MLKKVDLSGKTILITGANDGIGKEAAIALSQMDAKLVIIACRESVKSKKALEDISSDRNNVILEFVDLSDLSSVKALVDRLLSTEIKLDVLINNAGLMASERKLTVDGFEMQFGTNFLSHFLLTELLLKNNAFNDKARIINVSSHLMFFGKIDFDDIHFEKRKYSEVASYNQSKLANTMYSNYLNRTHANITSNALHPGVVRTQITRTSSILNALFNTVLYPIYYLLSKSPAQGAESTIYLASSPEVEGKGGMYWYNCKPYTMMKSKQSYNEKFQEQLYTSSQKSVAKYLVAE